MGTNLAKMSGPVTAGSVGFTGKGFTKGAPKGREHHRDQAHMKTQAAPSLTHLLPSPLLASPQLSHLSQAEVYPVLAQPHGR